MRAPILRAAFEPVTERELNVVLFAGGGGSSKGIEHAIGVEPDIAINHSPEALAVHAANHPHCEHRITDVWEVDPIQACRGRRVALAWFSPDCCHFSRAKGGKPRESKTRSLAWVVVRWARAVRPRILMLENVPEFETWGPLNADGTPNLARAGRTFRMWVGKLRALGYVVEWRTLVAADYGVPTTRKRLFLIARCDGEPIVWPEPTHERASWRQASDVIEWDEPCPSIFGRKKPLVEATLQRIADGLRRHVLEAERPFVRPVGSLVAAPLLTKAYGGPNGNTNAGLDIRSPLGTITAQDHHYLVTVFLTKHTGAPVVAASGLHAFLVKYYGAGGQHQSLTEPLHTVTAKARFGLVMVRSEAYRIVDIGMRMLTPRELFRGQGFADDYVIDPLFNGRRLTKTAQVRLAGNSVCPPVARALVSANTTAPRERQRVAA